jgi:hypothetical protein
MAATTGPVLALGGITFANKALHGDVDWRVPVATGFAAMVFALGERVSEPIAVGVAWIALATVLLTRVDPKVPSPAETLLKYWNQGG